MRALTKNKLSHEQIQQLALHAFGEKIITSQIVELTEGYFNVAYLVTLETGEQLVLKIAPPSGTQVMTYEKTIMASEVKALDLLNRQTKIVVPIVRYYDDTLTEVNSEYFFMTKIIGKSVSSCRPSIEAGLLKDIYRQVGEMTKEINTITHSSFGYLSQGESDGSNWFDVFKKMMANLFADARRISFDAGVEEEGLIRQLEKEQIHFLEVQQSHLVHWDIWDGNIFIEKGKITGLIDFERCLWGDPLMEVGFRSHEQKPEFLLGYGLKAFSESQQRRILWYDLYFFLIISQEADYRGYADKSMTKLGLQGIKETWKKISQ